MPTELRITWRLGLVIGVAVVLIGIAFRFVSLDRAAAVAGPTDPSSHRLPEDDLAKLGLTIGDPPALALPVEAAEEIAAAHYDPVALGATLVTGYLETVTVDGTARGPSPIVNRGVWIVKMSGMSQEQSGPMPSEGKAPAPAVLTTLYVFLDATSGEFLFAEWQQ